MNNKKPLIARKGKYLVAPFLKEEASLGTAFILRRVLVCQSLVGTQISAENKLPQENNGINKMINNNGNKNITIMILELMFRKVLMQRNPKSNPQFIKKITSTKNIENKQCK